MFSSTKTLVLAGVTSLLLLLPTAVQADDGFEFTDVPPIYAELDLSQDQQRQMLDYMNDTKAQIEAVISDDQRTAFEDSLSAGNSLEQALESMQIRPDQEEALANILVNQRQQMFGVLDQEQQRNLMRMVQQQRQSQPPMP